VRARAAVQHPDARRSHPPDAMPPNALAAAAALALVAVACGGRSDSTPHASAAPARDGLALVIPLDGGGRATLVDDTTSGEDYVRFEYVGRVDGVPFHLVRESHAEGQSFRLVHASTGRQVAVDAPPVVAPGGALFVTASKDLAAAFDPTRLAVWRVVGDSARVEWSAEPADWGPADAAWRGADTVAFTVHRPTPNDPAGSPAGAGTLVRDGATWRLRLPTP
jgi:hypothetical protein